MTKILLTILGLAITPVLLGLNYLTQDSAWLFIYGLLLTFTIFLYTFAGIGFSLMTYQENAQTIKDMHADLNWRFPLTIIYDISSFVYLVFSHDFYLATALVTKSILMLIFRGMIKAKTAALKV